MWYAANLLFESCHAGQPSEHNLWEEQIILIEAGSDAEAMKEAERLGNEDQPAYTNESGEHIHWRFRRVERVQVIDATTLASGTEVFSRFLRASEVRSLLTPFSDDSLPESALGH